MKIRSSHTTIAVLSLAMTLGLVACGGSDPASDSTMAADTTVAESTTTTAVADSTPTADKPAYCSLQPILIATDMTALTNAQATKASTAIDSVYSDLTAEMKPHAGPLLDFLVQWATMGGGDVNQTYIDHMNELTGLLSADCD